MRLRTGTTKLLGLSMAPERLPEEPQSMKFQDDPELGRHTGVIERERSDTLISREQGTSRTDLLQNIYIYQYINSTS